jgi:hypothetical protein
VITISHGPRIDDRDLLRLEAALGAELPADYRRFLRERNGREPEPNVVPHPDGNLGSVRWFLSIGTGDLYDLEAYVTEGVPLSPQLLAVAEDDFGNPYCVHLDTGRVYFWDRELEGGEDARDQPSPTPALLVADSFDQFLSSLRPAAA